MNKGLPQQLDRPSLCQLSKEELVEVVIEQATANAELQKTIFELRQQIQRLQLSRGLIFLQK